MRILITGSRDWEDRAAIYNALRDCIRSEPGPHTLVHGDCPTGADAIAHEIWWMRSVGWPIERHPADWGRHGRKAGPRRNAEMVALGADICLAFIRNGSNGASGTADKAEAAGIPTLRWEVTA